MAWLEKKGRRFLLVFRLNGARYKKLPVPTVQREVGRWACDTSRHSFPSSRNPRTSDEAVSEKPVPVPCRGLGF